jgi:PAS domain S-box-containing protein
MMIEHPEPTKAKILIVEDEALIALDLKMRLKNWGYTVLGHEFSAEKALEVIEQDLPDLILMDIVLQGQMDGIEAAQIIRSHWGIPVIFTTAFADMERIKRAKLAYPFGYLMKPYQERDIEVTIEMALYVSKVDSERRKAEEALQESNFYLMKAQERGKIGHFSFDPVSNIVTGSSEFFRIFNIDPSRPLFEGFASAVHPEDGHLIFPFIDRAVKEEIPYDVEHRVRHRNGNILFVHAKGEMISTPQGKRMVGIVQDITDRKEAEDQKLKQDRLNQTLLDSLPCVALLLRPKTREIVAMNQSAKEAGCLFGHTCYQTWPNFDQPCPWCLAPKLWADGQAHQCEVEALGIVWDAHWDPVAEDLFLHYAFDITERKRTEEILQKSEEKFAKAFQHAPLFMTISSLEDGTYLEVNDKFCQVSGFSREEALGRTSVELGWLSAGDRLELVKELRSRGRVVEKELTLQAKDGRTVYCLFNGETIDLQGARLLVTVALDITDRKRMEEDLLNSKMRLHYLLSSSPAIIYSCKPSGDYGATFISSNIIRTLGHEANDCISEPGFWINHIHPEDREGVLAGLLKIFEHDHHVHEYRFLHKDGTYRWMHDENIISRNADGEPLEIIGSWIDITERKRAEEKLRERQIFQQQLLDSLPVPVFYKDSEGRYLGCNAAFEDFFGQKREEITGKSVYDLSPKELADIYYEKDAALFQNPGRQIYESTIKSTDGVVHDVIFHKATFPGMNGSVGGLIGAILDVTERKRAEEALRESEKRYRLIAEHSNDWIYLIRPDKTFQYVSPSSQQITGYTSSEFLKNPGLFLDIIHPDDKEQMKSHLEIVPTETQAHNLEFRIFAKTGELCWIRHSCLPVYNDEGHYVGRSGTNRDITDRKLAEERLQASLKEKEVLLKEIHHRVKNNLAVIGSILSLQAQWVNDTNSQEIFRECENRVKTMAKIHSKLYQSKDLACIDLDSYLRDLTKDLLQSYQVNSGNVTINLKVADVRLDIHTTVPLCLVLNELLTNALKYAFPGGRHGDAKARGHKDTGTRGYGEAGTGGGVDTETGKEIKITLIKEDNQTVLIVGDNGIGFPSRLDFRNTKSLGLQLVMALVKQLHGTIEMEKVKGTVFTIRFKEL